MYRIDDATAATSLPTPETASTEGFFTEGNPTTGELATNVRGSWLNMIQEELRNVVVAAGLAPSKTTYNQVLEALKSLFPLATATPGFIGGSPALLANVAAGATTATFTDDTVNVASALNGVWTRLANFNATLNLATTGLGGMDTGTATANGLCGVYAYLTASGASGVFGQMENGAPLTKLYSGPNLPAGVIQTALLAVVPIGATAGQFATFVVDGRRTGVVVANLFATGTVPAGTTNPLTPVTITSAPYTARRLIFNVNIGASSAGSGQVQVSSVNALLGQIFAADSGTAYGSVLTSSPLTLAAPRTVYVSSQAGSSVFSYTLLTSGWEI